MWRSICAIMFVAAAVGCGAPAPAEEDQPEPKPLTLSPTVSSTSTTTVSTSPLLCQSRYDASADDAEARYGQCTYGAELHYDYCERHSTPATEESCWWYYEDDMDLCDSTYNSASLACESKLCYCLNPDPRTGGCDYAS